MIIIDYIVTCDIFSFVGEILSDFEISFVRSISLEWDNGRNRILIKPTNMSMVNEIIRTKCFLGIVILLIRTLSNELLIRIYLGIIPVIRKWSFLLISPINELVLITTAVSERNIRLMFFMIRMS
jgi:hypothetical protein